MPYSVRRERSTPRTRSGVPPRTTLPVNRNEIPSWCDLRKWHECFLPRLSPRAAQIARWADTAFHSSHPPLPRSHRAPTLLYVRPPTGRVQQSARHVCLSPVAKSWLTDSAPSLRSTPESLLGFLHR